jgi:hypothetical protein
MRTAVLVNLMVAFMKSQLLKAATIVLASNVPTNEPSASWRSRMTWLGEDSPE